jgi:hypothetical protein
MADIKFACPHCSQHITCDELWGGHQLDCPNCKNPLSVPAVAAPAPATPAAAAPRSLTPKVPEAAEPRLAINPTATATPGAPQKVIPIRNLTAPPPKKKSALVTYGITLVVLVALGAGGYFGYDWWQKKQEQGNTAASNGAAKSADGGEVAHIAKLNNALDATDPNKIMADTRNGARRQRRNAADQQTPAGSDNAAATTSTNAVDTEPLIPAVWTLDVTKARIPSGRANGALSGTNFVPQTARVDPVGNAQVLRLLQGQAVSPDREILIYLHLKAGEKLGGQTLSISQDMAGSGVPQVTKRWKTNPRFAPQYKSFSTGYAMRLELGQPVDGEVPGKIFLALPDMDQSVVAGGFKATIITNVVTVAVDAAAQAAPVMAPDAQRAAANEAFRARYGAH